MSEQPEPAAAAEGFQCTVDGYVSLTNEIAELLLVFVTVGVETLKTMLPPNLGKAVNYFYKFFTGFTSWIGYFWAGVNYFGIEYGFGDILCQVFGYGYMVVDALRFLIDFSGVEEM